MTVPASLLLVVMLLLVGSLSAITPALPFLSLRSRGMGRRIAAAPGAGKTRLAARLLIIFDMLCNLPVVAIDPNGALSNDVLDVIDRLPAWLRRRFEHRLVYINVGGQRIGQRTYVHTFPFLYTSASGNETVYTKAHRFLDVLAKTDPDQARAPVMGKAAIEDIGEKVLMALDALGWQITEAPLLIGDPVRYQPQLLAARERAPEAAPAIDYLLGEFARLPAREKEMKTGQFLRKISPFVLDPVLRAIYGGSTPSITPAEVVKHRLCVLLDFRDVPKAQRRLTIAWAYKYWDEYFRERGPGKHHIPICFYIDELSFLIPSGKQRHELVADDIAELLSVTSRNNQIFVTVIHQDLQQFDPRTNELLSRLGTQILGPSSDTDGAEQVARRFFRYDKTKAKHWRKVYGSSGFPGGGSVHIDDEPVFMTPEEQTIENAYKFLDLQAFHFLVGVARREGQLPTALQHVSFAALDASAYVRTERVDLLRALLMRQGGRPVAEILAEIAARHLEDVPRPEMESSPGASGGTGPVGQDAQARPPSRRSPSQRREPAGP